jgi:putative acetyltransferase
VTLTIERDDPRRSDVVVLLEVHLAHVHGITPAEGVFALDVEGLADPSVTFYSARRGEELVAVGALKDLGGGHGELKSMHVVAEERGQGVGRELLGHLIAVALLRGFERLSIETGNMDEFAPARRLYAAAGFVECEPFGPYVDSTTSTCMTLEL